MVKRITEDQRRAVLAMLANAYDRNVIAEAVGVTPGQVSAISAHVKMGTYSLPNPIDAEASDPLARAAATSRIIESLSPGSDLTSDQGHFKPVLVGTDAETGEPVHWNPDASTGAANPHVLILGESGYGKTYTISCILAELAERGVTSIVFDSGQSFARHAVTREFIDLVSPIEIQASRDGIAINPLQIFQSDVLGPLNVAQRVADTFSHVYSKLGIQQHAVLRQAVLSAFEERGINVDVPSSWEDEPPPFRSVYEALETIAANSSHPQNGVAANVASHISTMFVFNTFRPTGIQLSWPDVLRSNHRVLVLQLKGLEHSLERAVTEFLLWNLIGYIEANGPRSLQCFIVLDEAHRLCFDRGTPVEKLLREGRKFGLGLILASQHPDDFSPVAFGNTATKMIFQVADEKGNVARQVHRKIKDGHSFAEVFAIITKLPRGVAYVVSENIGRLVAISSFSNRVISQHRDQLR